MSSGSSPETGQAPRILFLSAYVGTGHMSAAEAVKKALLELRPQTQALVVDAYTYAGILLAKLASQGYIQLVKFLPFVYSFLYELPRRDSTLTALKSKFTRRVAQSFKKLVEDFKPHALVCTHAFPSGIASILKEEFHVPTISIVTDFTVHPFWIHKNTDLYLVGSNELRSYLIEQGIEPHRIQATGIPVDPGFSVKEEKPVVRKKLGLNPDLTTILVMGGGAGLGPIGSILRSLKKITCPIQVLVITGVNRRLRKKMENYAAKFNKAKGKNQSALRHVQVYGYVDNVYDFMNASDLLISKPGGLTSSEALALELPIAIVRPLPGQEVKNAQYLSREHAAIMVKREKDIAKTVDLLLKNPDELHALQGRARQLRKPKAAYEAARAILDLLGSSPYSPIQ